MSNVVFNIRQLNWWKHQLTNIFINTGAVKVPFFDFGEIVDTKLRSHAEMRIWYHVYVWSYNYEQWRSCVKVILNAKISSNLIPIPLLVVSFNSSCQIPKSLQPNLIRQFQMVFGCLSNSTHGLLTSDSTSTKYWHWLWFYLIPETEILWFIFSQYYQSKNLTGAIS